VTVIREENAMLGGSSDEKVELECPECGAKVKTTAKEAEKGKVKCPRGHEFAVMGMLGGLGGPR
jgi:peptide subunit release factor 1 (eRF1)